jgi:predicted transposase/invertase (TIGR01784 family)
MPKRPVRAGVSTEPIRPSTDLVFKAIMGHPDHPEILLEFLNAVLAPTTIVEVRVLNPAPVLQALSQKNLVVDIHAKDLSGTLFQIEM